MKRRVLGALALSILSFAGPYARSPQPVEIITAKVDRYLLLPQLLSPDWFFMEQPRLGKPLPRPPAENPASSRMRGTSPRMRRGDAPGRRETCRK